MTVEQAKDFQTVASKAAETCPTDQDRFRKALKDIKAA